MGSYLSLHYHVVFATKGRAPLMEDKWRARLFAYMAGTLKGLDGFPQCVNGWQDHVHLFFGLKATHVLADTVREVKKASTVWVKETVG